MAKKRTKKNILNISTLKEVMIDIEYIPKLIKAVNKQAVGAVVEHWKTRAGYPGLQARLSERDIKTANDRSQARRDPRNTLSGAYGFGLRRSQVLGDKRKKGAAFVSSGKLGEQIKKRSASQIRKNSRGKFHARFSIMGGALNFLGKQHMRGVTVMNKVEEIHSYTYTRENGKVVNVPRRVGGRWKVTGLAPKTFKQEWEFQQDELRFLNERYLRIREVLKRRVAKKQMTSKGKVRVAYARRLRAMTQL
jgi:hypothetical protein